MDLEARVSEIMWRTRWNKLVHESAVMTQPEVAPAAPKQATVEKDGKAP